MTRPAPVHRLTFLAAAAVIVLLAACAGPADPSSPSVAPATTSPAATASAPDASGFVEPDGSPAGDPLSGTLGYSDIEGGCPFLRTEDGTHFEVLYPEGWQVRRDPVALVSPDGEVVAEDGDEVTVHGRESTGSVSICQIGPIFEAVEVVRP